MLRISFLALIALGVTSGCSKEDDETETFQLLPLVSTAVEKAKATGITGQSLHGLQTAEMNLLATPPEAAEALRDFFTDSVVSLGGFTEQGWIDAYIRDLDFRIEEIQVETEPGCLAATPVSVGFDTGLAGHAVNLSLSCVRAYGGPSEKSGSGSGLAYGRDDTNYYLYLMLNQKDQVKDKFGFAAVVNRTTEEVQLLFLENQDTWNRAKFFHLKTSPSPKRLEYSVAGNSDGAGPNSPQTTHVLAPGVRFVSNDALLRAEGTVAENTTPTGDLGGTTAEFDSSECFDATNLAATPATCGNTAPNFTLPLVASSSMPDAEEAIDGALKTMQQLIDAGVGVDVPPPANGG